MNKKTVILINLGTPSAPTVNAIRAFLWRFLSDKRVVNLPSVLWKLILLCFILPFRPQKLTHQYQSIWQKNGSPLEVYTKQLTEKLQHISTKNNSSIDWRYAMTYSTPFLNKLLLECLRKKVDNLVIVPLYPQYSNSTTGAIYDQVFQTFNKKNNLPTLTIINNYHKHPKYIHALANSVQDFWQRHGKPQRLVMSFHGIPLRSVEQDGDPYAHQCLTTAQALANTLGLESHEWQLVFQSRFGKAKWLEPYCDKTLEMLPKQGITDIHIICPGFSMDCLETLEEISSTNGELFLQSGGKSYHYIPALNDSDTQCELIEQIIQEHRI